MTAPQTQDSPVAYEDSLTAWHEAGHAVVYLLQGRSLRYVTLRPRTAGRAGFTAVRPRRVDPSALAVVAHAGPLAQARHVLDTTSTVERRREDITAEDVRLDAYLHGGHDDLAVIAEARRAYGLPTRQPDLWAGIAQDLIDRYWTEIGRVATGLLEHRTVTGAQLRACVPGHWLAR
ncbi:M50 family metallopeptidase [Amycolatopsis sp. CA-230715]|uniref:M50 family metallopeptidase n=1 Tax=Amycolatopsis sp. CA-230715 TaxID=2745196 RepID=UPI001C01FDCB|nr:M50 family metallopeptidase [Amycolatopsis sp. CA-230715]